MKTEVKIGFMDAVKLGAGIYIGWGFARGIDLGLGKGFEKWRTSNGKNNK